MTGPLWTPSPERVERANLTRFMQHVRARGSTAVDYSGLYAWSIADPAAFWLSVWEFCEVVAEAGLHVGSGVGVQRGTAAGVDHVVDG